MQCLNDNLSQADFRGLILISIHNPEIRYYLSEL